MMPYSNAVPDFVYWMSALSGGLAPINTKTVDYGTQRVECRDEPIPDPTLEFCGFTNIGENLTFRYRNNEFVMLRDGMKTPLEVLGKL